MKKTEVYVGFGSSNIVLSVVGSGIVLREPSLVAVEIDTEKVTDWGTKAEKMQGRVCAGIDVFSPIERGIIKYPKFAKQLLSLALNKVFNNNVPKKTIITFVVRIGLTEEELSAYKQIANENDVGEVYFKYKPVLALSGAGVNLTNTKAYLSVTIGGGVTNLAVVSQGKIINGQSISLGGKDLDDAICEYIQNKYELDISLSIAEKIKTYCGSLILQDTSNMEVMGLDSKTKEAKRVFVSASDVRCAVIHFFEYIAKAIENLINKQSPDVLTDIMQNGIYLSGGTANLGGLQDLLYEKTKLVVHSFDSPENNPYMV